MPGAGASGVVRGDDLLRDGGSLLFRASMVGPPGARAGSRPATAFGGRDVTGVAHALPCVGSACEEDGWGDAALLGGTSGGLSEYLEERARAYSPPITIALQVSAGSAGLAGPSRFTQPCSVAAGGPGPGPGALLDVAYDTVLNCYVDTHTGQYYELARG